MMAFPPGPHVTHELAALCVTGLAPESGNVYAHGVQRRLPVNALRVRQSTLAAQFAQQLQRATQLRGQGQKVFPCRRLTAYVGQQAVA